MNKINDEKLIVEKMLLRIIRDNKDIFNKLPEENINKNELVECLLKAINRNGNINYLVKLLKENL